MDMLALFQCLQPHVTATGCRRFSRMAWAMLVMTGRHEAWQSSLGGQWGQLPDGPALRADRHPPAPDDRVLDLKADGRGYTYVEETRQMLPEKPAPVV